jgi:hypothetical protein
MVDAVVKRRAIKTLIEKTGGLKNTAIQAAYIQQGTRWRSSDRKRLANTKMENTFTQNLERPNRLFKV